MDYTIGFAYQPSIALLEIDTMEFDWIHDKKENNNIFDKLSKIKNFDYYYMNNILIIPDPIPSPRLNWSKRVFIDNLEIECKGNFISFFHYEINKNFILADSLTFPEYLFVKNNIRIT